METKTNTQNPQGKLENAQQCRWCNQTACISAKEDVGYCAYGFSFESNFLDLEVEDDN